MPAICWPLEGSGGGEPQLAGRTVLSMRDVPRCLQARERERELPVQCMGHCSIWMSPLQHATPFQLHTQGGRMPVVQRPCNQAWQA